MYTVRTYFRNTEFSLKCLKIQSFNTEAKALAALPASRRVTYNPNNRTFSVIPL